jgi:hypothetical protein
MPGAGTYHDPTNRRAPTILEEGASVTITDEEPSFERIPAVFGGVPRYELGLGKQRPFALTIETGASDFDLDLGGVPLTRIIHERSGRLRSACGKTDEFASHAANSPHFDSDYSRIAYPLFIKEARLRE